MGFHVQAAPEPTWQGLFQRAGVRPTPDFKAIMALDDRGVIAGMVGFDTWTLNSAQLHVAIDNPACARTLTRAAFEYLFNQAGRGIALGVVRGDNARALKFDKGLGFVEVSRIRDGWAEGVDMVLLELRKENCRWLRRKKAA